jgi:hypothetical protein
MKKKIKFSSYIRKFRVEQLERSSNFDPQFSQFLALCVSAGKSCMAEDGVGVKLYIFIMDLQSNSKCTRTDTSSLTGHKLAS